MAAISEARQTVDQVFQFFADNPPALLLLIVVVGFLLIAKKKFESDSIKDFEEKDWDKATPEKLKYLTRSVGFDSSKRLERGEGNKLGTIFKYDKQFMPSNKEFQDLVFGIKEEEGEKEEKTEWEEVYVFLLAPTGFARWIWKVTDVYFGMNLSTSIYIASADKVEEEFNRFILEENIQFKNTYDAIFTEKGTAPENVTDQFPVYKARERIVQGIEEFTSKVLYFDRVHTSEMSKIKNEIDEEVLEKFLKRGKNF